MRVVVGAPFSNPLLTLSSLRWLHENERGSAADYAGRVRSSLPAFRSGANAAAYGDNKALRLQPLHVGLWREYLRSLENMPAEREKAVEELNRTAGAFSPTVMGAVLSVKQ